MSTAKLQAKALLAMQLQVRFLCRKQRHYENTCSQGYDTKASLYAIGNFESMALSIQASSAQDMLGQLQAKIDHARKNSQMPGQHNGGIGTYGSLLRNVEHWHDHELAQQNGMDLWISNTFKSSYLNFLDSNLYDNLRFQYQYEKKRWLMIGVTISLAIVGVIWY